MSHRETGHYSLCLHTACGEMIRTEMDTWSGPPFACQQPSPPFWTCNLLPASPVPASSQLWVAFIPFGNFVLKLHPNPSPLPPPVLFLRGDCLHGTVSYILYVYFLLEAGGYWVTPDGAQGTTYGARDSTMVAVATTACKQVPYLLCPLSALPPSPITLHFPKAPVGLHPCSLTGNVLRGMPIPPPGVGKVIFFQALSQFVHGIWV